MPQRRPSASNRRRSQQLGLQLRCGAINQQFYRKMNGAPARVRTRDPLITNQVLYQLSYKGSGAVIKGKSNCGKAKFRATDGNRALQYGRRKNRLRR